MPDKHKKNRTNKATFPIVCVGASAGGLEALISFLSSLPKDIAMAFVLIQHLEPKHKSALSEILSRETALDLHEAKNNTKIEASHCYVISPNTFMAVSHGILKITSRKKRVDGKYLPIDFFMTSLAEDRGDKSIGIVLSGTGADGTEGIKAIRLKGGITFAQSEETAKYFGMPESAIASGSVDFILDPKEIAKQLMRIGVPGYRKISKRAVKPRKGEIKLASILELLRELAGIDFMHYKQTTINRRIARRMEFHNIKSYSDYYNLIDTNASESELLFKDLLISVTSFFRDPEVFTALKKKVIPLIPSKRLRKGPIRIWVPACSTGEEVYSIAMTVYESFEEKKIRPHIQIFGTDISEALIKKARLGQYSNEMLTQVSPGRLRRFFVKTEKGYKIAKDLRDLCIFAKHDVTNDPPLSNIDIVSCRNLLIYFDSFLQNRALARLYYALNPGGSLVLGTAESVSALPDHFTVIDKTHKLYSKNTVARKYINDTVMNAALSSSRSNKGNKTSKKPEKIINGDRPLVHVPMRKAGSTKQQTRKTPRDETLLTDSTEMNIATLRKAFAKTIAKLNAISEEKDTFNEELKAANEEIQSSNEELQSMNEELETSKEELQSTNEELLTLNDELQNKNTDLTHLNNDFSNVFTSTNIPMIIVGNDLRIKRFTPTARKMMNLIPTDVDRPISDIKLNIDMSNMEAMIREVIDEIVPKESEIKDFDGRWYSVRIRPYLTLDKRIDGAIVSLIDIDAIKRSREEIQGALDYAQAIIETMREPLLVLDKGARVLSANKAFYDTFQIGESEVINKLLYDLRGSQWESRELRKLIGEVLPTKSQISDFEIIFDTPGEGQRTMKLNGRQIESLDKGNQLILLVFEDITKRKKADELLKRDSDTLELLVEERSRELLELRVSLERAKHLSNIGMLAATVAHELRNTLAGIKLSAYNIRKKIKDPQIDKNLITIEKKITEGAQIINNVLSYSKIKISNFESIVINDILKLCIDEAKEQASHRSLAIHENLEHTKDLSIEADSIQIREVFSNILNNAIDSVHKDSGLIEIETNANETTVSVVIKDNGEGIIMENIGRVIEPFFTTKAKGTGLGLSVCNQILMLHDGSMDIKSEIGKGTAIHVTLPIQRTNKSTLHAFSALRDR